MQSNTDIIRELKDMNVSMLRQQPLSSGMLQSSLSTIDPKEEVKAADVPVPEHRI
jgi:c-di-GMP-binding flagellar brake protein YcgR